jgi:alkanesulfonate monooxygenase SsuD/methylene tetrahydromethanopterin reductase-like flavin-dependent oxidoreductase (luciferase family)
MLVAIKSKLGGGIHEIHRPIGRNNERYQAMLDELRRLAVFADDAGFDVMSTTEHHFHSEGYETSVAPLLIYADLAARTKRIKFSPLGLVLPAWDPIRCAEELAVLDHLTKGRMYAGFARGYQDRWVNVLGQQYHVTGAPMDGSSIDQHNRKVYEETLKVIKLAWTQESFEYDGEYYKVPYPHDGIRRWPVAEWTLERMRRVKYALAGTVDQVKREIEALRKVGGDGDLEWFGWFFDQGFMSWDESMDESMRQMELFAKHIIPAFR